MRLLTLNFIQIISFVWKEDRHRQFPTKVGQLENFETIDREIFKALELMHHRNAMIAAVACMKWQKGRRFDGEWLDPRGSQVDRASKNQTDAFIDTIGWEQFDDPIVVCFATPWR